MRAVLDATRRRTLRPVRAAVAGLAAALLVVGLGALAPAPRPTATSDTSAASDRTAPEPEPVGGAASVAAAAAADARPAAARNVLPATPAPQATSCGTEPDGWRNVSTQSNDDRTRLEWSKPGCEVDVRLQGDIEFTADFRDVAGLDRDARLRIEETDEGTRRMLEITAGPGGRPEYAYEVDREERPFDAAARAWYDGLLLQVFRRTGHLAEERVAALLREGGVPAVLRELDELHSDHAFASYTEALLGQAAELSDAQALDVVGRARARVDSDHYLAGILESFAAGHLDSDVMVDEYLAASEAIESDHYRAGVLEIALGRGGLTVAQVGATLESASGIESDHYLAEVLAGVAERYSLEPSLRQVYLRAVSSIESDHYRAEVLGGLLERNDLTAAELAVVLDAAGGIASDSYTAGVLAKVADRDLSSDALRGAYLRVAAGIESDHYRAASLGDLLDRGDDLTDAQVVEIVRAATGIESDHYKAEVLGRVAREHSIEGATREALIEALNTIESDHYRGQVAELVLRR
jgi:hypothetical protein